MTPSGIEPANFLFAAQHPNHCATAGPWLEYTYEILKCEINTGKGDRVIVGGGAINTGKGDRVIVGGGAINTGKRDRLIVGGGAINTGKGDRVIVGEVR